MTKSLGFILVKTQLPENIGFSARALKNFNFENLDIVSPKKGWANKKALDTSVSAKDILYKIGHIEEYNYRIEINTGSTASSLKQLLDK